MRRYLLGIDCGGTHTDCVLLEQEAASIRLLGEAKTTTDHNDLPSSITRVLKTLGQTLKDPTILAKVTQVTLGTTLAVNALVQGKADPVGLVLTAGPGLSPKRFLTDEPVVILSGGLDHRGVEVTALNLQNLAPTAQEWKKKGISSVACVGKFSPRNPHHETTIAQALEKMGFAVSCGHTLSGELNFPRRIFTAYYNAQVTRIECAFLDAVRDVLASFDIKAQVFLLKADGGALAVSSARQTPVQSILSGPAASIMGVLALSSAVDHGVSLLLDIGGTTTDIAVLLDGSPILDREGMRINDHATLVRSIASQSIGVGGDSKISVHGKNGEAVVQTGPVRVGCAMAFGGEEPTLLDAINFLDHEERFESGDHARSRKGIEQLALRHEMQASDLAQRAIDAALTNIKETATKVLAHINAGPIYTLAKLRSRTTITPARVLLVGGPAPTLQERIAKCFDLPVFIPEHASVANAIGACVTRPTAFLTVYADTGKRELRVPTLDYVEPLARTATLAHVKERAIALFLEQLKKEGIEDADVEVLEADLFATLDNYGGSSRDMRVTCQIVPGIQGRPTTCK